jgi:hypothetical protein
MEEKHLAIFEMASSMTVLQRWISDFLNLFYRDLDEPHRLLSWFDIAVVLGLVGFALIVAYYYS